MMIFLWFNTTSWLRQFCLIKSCIIFICLTTGDLHDANAQKSPPNFIIILTDDQGYGDLGCYGHPTIKTPHIDRMAAEGQRCTNFMLQPMFAHSRAALLTGRYGVRNGMYSKDSRKRVLFPDFKGGLPQREITIPKILQRHGYKTACIGKWHLGHLPDYLPSSMDLTITKNNPAGYPQQLEKLDKQQLYNLQHDPSERYNIAD